MHTQMLDSRQTGRRVYSTGRAKGAFPVMINVGRKVSPVPRPKWPPVFAISVSGLRLL
jgi:hypothetical protein